MFLERYIAQDIDSAEVFHGIADFFHFFALKGPLRYRLLKIVWADSPNGMRVKVNIFLSVKVLLTKDAGLHSDTIHVNEVEKTWATVFKLNVSF